MIPFDKHLALLPDAVLLDVWRSRTAILPGVPDTDIPDYARQWHRHINMPYVERVEYLRRELRNRKLLTF
jgi:hypothetical protein